MRELLQLWKLYKPMLYGLIAILVVWFNFYVTRGKNIAVSLKFFVIETPIDITDPNIMLIIKVFVILVIILITFLIYLLKDYSLFFPKRMKMTVFFSANFDPKQIHKKVGVVNIGDSKISYIKSKSNKYFNDCDKAISDYINEKKYFKNSILDGNGVMESTGETTFVLRKIKGIQKYEIVESSGTLKHKLVVKGEINRDISVRSKFEKTPSDNDIVNAPINIFKKIILAPEFCQFLIVNAKEQKLMHHTLCGVTKISIFPIPKYSDTVYFYKVNKMLIPIGYARYIEA